MNIRLQFCFTSPFHKEIRTVAGKRIDQSVGQAGARGNPLRSADIKDQFLKSALLIQKITREGINAS